MIWIFETEISFEHRNKNKRNNEMEIHWVIGKASTSSTYPFSSSCAFESCTYLISASTALSSSASAALMLSSASDFSKIFSSFSCCCDFDLVPCQGGVSKMCKSPRASLALSLSSNKASWLWLLWTSCYLAMSRSYSTRILSRSFCMLVIFSSITF